MEKDLNRLDKILNVAYINLYTLSKEDGIIRLSKVNLKDDRHWVVLNLLRAVCDTVDCYAYLDMSWWQFRKLKKVLPSFRLLCARHNGGMTCDKFINDLEEVNKDFFEEPFLTAAKEYYPRKD